MGAKQQALQNYTSVRQQAQDNYARRKATSIAKLHRSETASLTELQNNRSKLCRNKQQALQNYLTGRQQGISNYATALQNASASYQLGAQDPLLALTGRASRAPSDVLANSILLASPWIQVQQYSILKAHMQEHWLPQISRISWMLEWQLLLIVQHSRWCIRFWWNFIGGLFQQEAQVL